MLGPGGPQRCWSSIDSHHRARTLGISPSPSAMGNWAEVTKAMSEKTGEPNKFINSLLWLELEITEENLSKYYQQ